METKVIEVDYLIVGAGPAGIQMGYFMERAGLNYRIVEGGSQPGEFFATYPRHRKLISINKVHTGYDDPEKNMRWDWNSLLSDSEEMLFKNYSRVYFPPAEALLDYMRDFVAHYDLKIDYDTRIGKVRRDGVFEASTGDGRVYRARRVVMATGVSKPYVPAIEGIELAEQYADFSVDPEDFAGQSVLILGKGNSAFETADNLIETTSMIHVASPRPLKLAWNTKFVGNLRAINNNFLDTYQLKSQNAILDGEVSRIFKRDGKYVVEIAYTHANGEIEQLVYDRVLICTGFRFDADVFSPECRPALAINDRFPQMTSAWESTNVEDLYFSGTITQQRDFKRSSSGFIHGFRYNVRSLFNILRKRYEGQPLPSQDVAKTAEALTSAMLERINKNSGLWQQFAFLCDVLNVDTDGDARYYQEMQIEYAHTVEFAGSGGYFVITLEFGSAVSDPFAIDRNPDPAFASESKFLHPVVRYCAHGVALDEQHLLEDLHSDWSKPCHYEPLLQFVSSKLAPQAQARAAEAASESMLG